MPRKDDRSGGKKTSSNGVDDYYNKRNEELKSSSKSSWSAVNRGEFDDLYDEGKADLQTAQFKSILSGVPYVGPLLQGLEGAQQLEDLYNSTGKVPAYPTLDGRASGIGYTASKVADAVGGKILGGAHDLYQFYAGEPDAFRGMMNNAYM